MNWYEGSVAEAVAMSKTKKAIFVVYVEGKDEVTHKLTKIIDEEKIKSRLETDDFVAIKISSDSKSYMQFAKIYQVVPVPSIFFIGLSGTPLEIGTGIIASSDELVDKIENVLVQSGKSAASSSVNSASESFIAAEKETSEEPSASTQSNAKVAEIVGNVQEEKKLSKQDTTDKVKEKQTVAPIEKSSESLGSADSKKLTEGQESLDNKDLKTRVEETRKQLEQKRRERLEMTRNQEKEDELRRRIEGKQLQDLQIQQNEQRLKELKENIRRQRMEEQATRERIRAQIAGDRAERAQKFAQEAVRSTEVVNQRTSKPQDSVASDRTRLQFRLSTGDNKTQTFNYGDTLSVVRAFVVSDLIPGTGIRDFILATTYPKREFTAADDAETLEDLGLVPSAVILVIGKERKISPAAVIVRSGGLFNMCSSAFWTLLTPLLLVFGYFKRVIGSRGSELGTQKRTNEDQAAQPDPKRRNVDRFTSGPSTSRQSAAGPTNVPDTDSQVQRRYMSGSNIHRLSDKRNDSDDENATWNGNSTQQQ